MMDINNKLSHRHVTHFHEDFRDEEEDDEENRFIISLDDIDSKEACQDELEQNPIELRGNEKVVKEKQDFGAPFSQKPLSLTESTNLASPQINDNVIGNVLHGMSQDINLVSDDSHLDHAIKKQKLKDKNGQRIKGLKEIFAKSTNVETTSVSLEETSMATNHEAIQKHDERFIRQAAPTQISIGDTFKPHSACSCIMCYPGRGIIDTNHVPRDAKRKHSPSDYPKKVKVKKLSSSQTSTNVSSNCRKFVKKRISEGAPNSKSSHAITEIFPPSESLKESNKQPTPSVLIRNPANASNYYFIVPSASGSSDIKTVPTSGHQFIPASLPVLIPKPNIPSCIAQPVPVSSVVLNLCSSSNFTLTSSCLTTTPTTKINTSPSPSEKSQIVMVNKSSLENQVADLKHVLNRATKVDLSAPGIVLVHFKPSSKAPQRSSSITISSSKTQSQRGNDMLSPTSQPPLFPTHFRENTLFGLVRSHLTQPLPQNLVQNTNLTNFSACTTQSGSLKKHTKASPSDTKSMFQYSLLDQKIVQKLPTSQCQSLGSLPPPPPLVPRPSCNQNKKMRYAHGDASHPEEQTEMMVLPIQRKSEEERSSTDINLSIPKQDERLSSPSLFTFSSAFELSPQKDNDFSVTNLHNNSSDNSPQGTSGGQSQKYGNCAENQIPVLISSSSHSSSITCPDISVKSSHQRFPCPVTGTVQSVALKGQETMLMTPSSVGPHMMTKSHPVRSNHDSSNGANHFSTSALSCNPSSSSSVSIVGGLKMKIRLKDSQLDDKAITTDLENNSMSKQCETLTENSVASTCSTVVSQSSMVAGSSVNDSPMDATSNTACVETAEEMFKRFEDQAMRLVYNAQFGVGEIQRNLRPNRTTTTLNNDFLYSHTTGNGKGFKKKKINEEKSKFKSDGLGNTENTSSLNKNPGRVKRKRSLSGEERPTHSFRKSNKLDINQYPRLMQDNSIVNRKTIYTPNILAGHKVYVKFNVFSNGQSGRSFLVPFFNIGGSRTQFDVEDMEYINTAVADFEKDEKSCARHLLFYSREGNKAVFLRKESGLHSNELSSKSYKKHSFILEGYKREKSKQIMKPVDEWTVDNGVQIEIDRAELEYDLDLPGNDVSENCIAVEKNKTISQGQIPSTSEILNNSLAHAKDLTQTSSLERSKDDLLHKEVNSCHVGWASDLVSINDKTISPSNNTNAEESAGHRNKVNILKKRNKPENNFPSQICQSTPETSCNYTETLKKVVLSEVQEGNLFSKTPQEQISTSLENCNPMQNHLIEQQEHAATQIFPQIKSEIHDEEYDLALTMKQKESVVPSDHLGISIKSEPIDDFTNCLAERMNISLHREGSVSQPSAIECPSLCSNYKINSPPIRNVHSSSSTLHINDHQSKGLINQMSKHNRESVNLQNDELFQGSEQSLSPSPNMSCSVPKTFEKGLHSLRKNPETSHDESCFSEKGPGFGSPSDEKDPSVGSPSDEKGPGIGSPSDEKGPGVGSPSDEKGPGVDSNDSPSDEKGPGVGSSSDEKGPGVGSPSDEKGPGVGSPTEQTSIEKSPFDKSTADACSPKSNNIDDPSSDPDSKTLSELSDITSSSDLETSQDEVEFSSVSNLSGFEYARSTSLACENKVDLSTGNNKITSLVESLKQRLTENSSILPPLLSITDCNPKVKKKKKRIQKVSKSKGMDKSVGFSSSHSSHKTFDATNGNKEDANLSELALSLPSTSSLSSLSILQPGPTSVAPDSSNDPKSAVMDGERASSSTKRLKKLDCEKCELNTNDGLGLKSKDSSMDSEILSVCLNNPLKETLQKQNEINDAKNNSISRGKTVKPSSILNPIPVNSDKECEQMCDTGTRNNVKRQCEHFTLSSTNLTQSTSKNSAQETFVPIADRKDEARRGQGRDDEVQVKQDPDSRLSSPSSDIEVDVGTDEFAEEIPVKVIPISTTSLLSSPPVPNFGRDHIKDFAREHDLMVPFINVRNSKYPSKKISQTAKKPKGSLSNKNVEMAQNGALIKKSPRNIISQNDNNNGDLKPSMASLLCEKLDIEVESVVPKMKCVKGSPLQSKLQMTPVYEKDEIAPSPGHKSFNRPTLNAIFGVDNVAVPPTAIMEREKSLQQFSSANVDGKPRKRQVARKGTNVPKVAKRNRKNISAQSKSSRVKSNPQKNSSKDKCLQRKTSVPRNQSKNKNKISSEHTVIKRQNLNLKNCFRTWRQLSHEEKVKKNQSLSNYQQLCTIPCTIVLQRLEDIQLDNNVYYIGHETKGFTNKSIPSRATDLAKGHVNTNIRKRKKRPVLKAQKRKRASSEKKKDIVDYYASMLETLRKKAQQLEEEVVQKEIKKSLSEDIESEILKIEPCALELEPNNANSAYKEVDKGCSLSSENFPGHREKCREPKEDSSGHIEKCIEPQKDSSGHIEKCIEPKKDSSGLIEKCIEPKKDSSGHIEKCIEPKKDSSGHIEKCIEPKKDSSGLIEKCIEPKKDSSGLIEKCILEPQEGSPGQIEKCIEPNKNSLGHIEKCLEPKEDSPGHTEKCINPKDNSSGHTEMCLEPKEDCPGRTEGCTESKEACSGHTMKWTEPTENLGITRKCTESNFHDMENGMKKETISHSQEAKYERNEITSNSKLDSKFPDSSCELKRKSATNCENIGLENICEKLPVQCESDEAYSKTLNLKDPDKKLHRIYQDGSKLLAANLMDEGKLQSPSLDMEDGEKPVPKPDIGSSSLVGASLENTHTVDEASCDTDSSDVGCLVIDFENGGGQKNVNMSTGDLVSAKKPCGEEERKLNEATPLLKDMSDLLSDSSFRTKDIVLGFENELGADTVISTLSQADMDDMFLLEDDDGESSMGMIPEEEVEKLLGLDVTGDSEVDNSSKLQRNDTPKNLSTVWTSTSSSMSESHKLHWTPITEEDLESVNENSSHDKGCCDAGLEEKSSTSTDNVDHSSSKSSSPSNLQVPAKNHHVSPSWNRLLGSEALQKMEESNTEKKDPSFTQSFSQNQTGASLPNVKLKLAGALSRALKLSAEMKRVLSDGGISDLSSSKKDHKNLHPGDVPTTELNNLPRSRNVEDHEKFKQTVMVSNLQHIQSGLCQKEEKNEKYLNDSDKLDIEKFKKGKTETEIGGRRVLPRQRLINASKKNLISETQVHPIASSSKYENENALTDFISSTKSGCSVNSAHGNINQIPGHLSQSVQSSLDSQTMSNASSSVANVRSKLLPFGTKGIDLNKLKLRLNPLLSSSSGASSLKYSKPEKPSNSHISSSSDSLSKDDYNTKLPTEVTVFKPCESETYGQGISRLLGKDNINVQNTFPSKTDTSIGVPEKLIGNSEPSLLTSKLCNILKNIKKPTSGSKQMILSSDSSSKVQKCSDVPHQSKQEVKCNAKKNSRRLRSSLRLPQAQRRKEPETASNVSSQLDQDKRKKKGDDEDKGGRSFFDCLSDVVTTGAWEES